MHNRLPRIVMLFAWIPALGLAAVLILWGLIEQKSSLVMPLLNFMRLPLAITEGPQAYRLVVWTLAYYYFFQIELFFSMILVLLVGPNLISQDLRFNALPLYFSRPLRRIDYFMGKLGVIGVFLGAVAILPALIAYVLGMCFSLDLSVIKDTFHLLAASVAYGLVIVLSAGTLMLALSCLSRNSRYVAAFWVGIWFVSSVISGVLVGFHLEEGQRRLAAAYQERWRLPAGPQRPGRPQRPGPPGLLGDPRLEEIDRKIDKIVQELYEESRSDWRPLFSYTRNLERVGSTLLDTEAAWDKIGELVEGPRGRRELNQFRGAQYPWYWSGGVLLGLLGVSVWILTSRVKSLDRLR
jgi:ABC-2 type transport system permease protein